MMFNTRLGVGFFIVFFVISLLLLAMFLGLAIGFNVILIFYFDKTTALLLSEILSILVLLIIGYVCWYDTVKEKEIDFLKKSKEQ